MNAEDLRQITDAIYFVAYIVKCVGILLTAVLSVLFVTFLSRK